MLDTGRYMDKRFNSYQKIPESSASWILDKKSTNKLQQAKWCVTEKIHGANFCWLVNKTEILCAKRKAILTPTDNFFGYEVVKEKLSSSIRQIFDSIITSKPDVQDAYIYGELFGGLYPHPDVTPNPQIQPIQTGVYYSSTIEFCAFDIAIHTKEDFKYLDYRMAIELFEQSSLLYSRPLFVGKMQDALAYPVKFKTTIPPLLNLPPLEEPNYAEGVVIKPVEPLEVQTSKGLVRPILKKKILEFSEDARYHQAEKWQEKSERRNVDDYILDELEWDINMLVTKNRLNNTISKVGHLNKRTANEIGKLLTEDVQEELASKYGERLLQLKSEDKELVNLILKDCVNTLIKQKFTE